MLHTTQKKSSRTSRDEEMRVRVGKTSLMPQVLIRFAKRSWPAVGIEWAIDFGKWYGSVAWFLGGP